MQYQSKATFKQVEKEWINKNLNFNKMGSYTVATVTLSIWTLASVGLSVYGCILLYLNILCIII